MSITEPHDDRSTEDQLARLCERLREDLTKKNAVIAYQQLALDAYRRAARRDVRLSKKEVA